MARTSVSAIPDIEKAPGDSQTYACNFTEVLSGRSLSGSPTVASDDAGLTVGSPALNSSTYVDDYTGETVAANKAVQYACSAGVAGTTYKVTITATSDDGSTIVGYQHIKVRSS